jgi:hypothetical protein
MPTLRCVGTAIASPHSLTMTYFVTRKPFCFVLAMFCR